MSDTEKLEPIERLEVSALAAAAFRRLGLATVGDLCAVTPRRFLDAAYACAADDQRVAPALSEVANLLAAMGLGLAPDAPGAPARSVPNDGEPLEGATYLGSFRCTGALVFGERRFIGRGVDQPRLAASTIDLAAPGGPGNRVRNVDLGRVEVEAGTWDAYEVPPAFRARRLIVQHREATWTPAVHRRHIGGLSLPDPLVVVVDAASAGDVGVIGQVRASPRGSFDQGCMAALAFDELYEWTTFTCEPGGRGPIRRLEIQAGSGE